MSARLYVYGCMSNWARVCTACLTGLWYNMPVSHMYTFHYLK